jgi:hypothetical protein
VGKKLSLVLEVLVNFVLPWLCYRFAKGSLGETGALLLSTAPPIVWSLCMILKFSLIGWTFWYVRRLKAAMQRRQANS